MKAHLKRSTQAPRRAATVNSGGFVAVAKRTFAFWDNARLTRQFGATKLRENRGPVLPIVRHVCIQFFLLHPLFPARNDMFSIPVSSIRNHHHISGSFKSSRFAFSFQPHINSERPAQQLTIFVERIEYLRKRTMKRS